MKTVLLFCIAPAILFAATDYFPTDTGNTWTFSYVSSAYPVVPNPIVTRDSGTVKWEALRPIGNSLAVYFRFKQTRSLVRRTVSGGTNPGYDSIFSPTHITMDTVILSRPVVLTDTSNLRDSLENGLTFSNATCPAAVHDFSKPVPAGLTVEDTAVHFDGSAYACKKITPPECSCLNYQRWSFVLADKLGPVKISITLCPGYVGGNYSETRQIVSREYPTVAVKERYFPPGVSYPSSAAVYHLPGPASCGITVVLPSHPATTSADLYFYDLSGRMVDRMRGVGAKRVFWKPRNESVHCCIVLVKTGLRTYAHKLMAQ